MIEEFDIKVGGSLETYRWNGEIFVLVFKRESLAYRFFKKVEGLLS